MASSVGRSIFAWLLEGEVVVLDDVGVLNSYFFSRVDTVSVNGNGDIEHLAHDSARKLREVHEGVRCLKGNFGGI